MAMMSRGLVLVAVFLFVVALSSSGAADDWLGEFNDICSQIDVVDSLEREEVQRLVERCDELMPVIEASENPKKKVYLFRLKKARDMFAATPQFEE
jgi:hypothetical protein